MKKVLIIEDDEHIGRIYDIKLKKESFQTLMAGDGEKGFAMIAKEKPDLVLLDLMLPKKDGFWVLEEMKKKPALKKVNIIVLSNLGQKADMDRCFSLGAKEYLVKVDHSIQEVVDTIKKYVA
jgi:DNA-binding response OmpR family regulator